MLSVLFVHRNKRLLEAYTVHTFSYIDFPMKLDQKHKQNPIYIIINASISSTMLHIRLIKAHISIWIYTNV